MRATADTVEDELTEPIMLRIAELYEKLAKRAEVSELGKPRHVKRSDRYQLRLLESKKKAPIQIEAKLVAPISGWRLPDAGRKMPEHRRVAN
jgi:hypothetical protein